MLTSPRAGRSRRRNLVVAVAAVLVLSSCAEVVTLRPPTLDETAVVPPSQSYVYDADGNQLAILRKEFRDRVALDRMPRHLVDAVVAAEDRRFWHHAGVDARAVTRAALVNYATGQPEQGGSTITQQLVKNLYMPDAPRTMRTKVREALLAWELEEERSKEEILSDYLNTVYFGNGAYGVQAAAYTYWRKDVTDVDLAEAALLAGLIRAPESGSPERAPEVARARRDRILEAMVEDGTAPRPDVERAKQRPVEVEPRPPTPRAEQPYWVDFVVRSLLNDTSFGDDESDRAERLFGGGLRIHTTLDRRMQAAAESAAQRYLSDPSDPEVAIAAIDPSTGKVLAAVGGRDHSVSQFDLATQARRQPGSAFKTFVLTAALGAGYLPDTVVNGDEGSLAYGDGQVFRVRNFTRSSPGRITLAEAVRSSVNGAFARLILDTGIDRTIAAARALGITSPLNEDPAIALGGLRHGVSPLEMASAYATLANDGTHIPPSAIDRIEDAEGNVVWRPTQRPRVAVDPAVAWLVTQMLRGVVEDGTGARARLPGWEVAGKTGTTSDHTDAWFVGYTPTLAAAVWMGHPEGRVPMRWVGGERTVTGGSWPARIWREFAIRALRGQRPTGFELPDAAAVEVEIDPKTGLLAAPWCPGETREVPRLLVPDRTCPSPRPTPSPIRPSSDDPNDEEGREPSPSPAATASPVPTPSPEPDGQPSADPSPGPSPQPSPQPTPTPRAGSPPEDSDADNG